MNAKRQKNFFVVNKDTSISEIETAFNKLVERKDVAIVLITQKVLLVCQTLKTLDRTSIIIYIKSKF